MNATVKDYEDIVAVVGKYVEGGNAGSGDVMKPAFHEAATINGQPIQTLFDGADAAGPTDSVARIDVLDVVNDIACVRVTMEGYHGHDYVDFHELMKVDGAWRIVAKIYTEV